MHAHLGSKALLFSKEIMKLDVVPSEVRYPLLIYSNQVRIIA